MDGWVHSIQMVQESLQSIILYNTDGVIHVPPSHIGLSSAVARASSSKNSMYRLATMTDTGEPMAVLSLCSYKAPRKELNSLGGTQAHLQEIRHPVCRQRGSILVCPVLLQLLPDHTHSFLHGDIGEWRGDVKIILLQVSSWPLL